MFTANGALQSVRAVGEQDAYGGGAAFDRRGSSYAAHLFVGPANLGGATHIAPNYDSLFGRYDSAGELRTSFHRGGLGNDEVGSIEVDSAGNLWLAGQYHDTTQYGGPTLPDPYIEREAFVVKLTAEGQHVFSRSLASRGPDYYPRVDLDERNQAWISQPFEGTLDLGGGRVLTSNENSRDLAIIHLDAGGDVLAAWSVGGAADEHAITHDLAADGDEVVLAFTVGAAGATIGGIPVGGKGGYDIAVVRFAADGRVLSARTYGTAEEDYASSIDVGPSGTLLAGYFGAGLPSSQLSFDNATLTSGGFSDGFVAMLRREALRYAPSAETSSEHRASSR